MAKGYCRASVVKGRRPGTGCSMDCKPPWAVLCGTQQRTAHVLGIQPGEAVVIRNIGGRTTPGLLGILG